MKKYFFTLLPALFFSALFGQPKADIPMGLGIAKVLFSPADQSLYFFADAESERKVDSIFYGQDVIHYAPPWFFPEFLKPDYNICHLRILTLTRNRAEVVVNRQTGQTAWVDREAMDCQYWPDFLLNVFSVYPEDKESNPLMIRPFDHSSGSPLFEKGRIGEGLSVKGDWIQVQLRDSQYQPIGKAWFRWRKGDKLLAVYDLLS